jgi:hypothetical protein
MEPFDLSIEQYNGQSETQPSITVAPLAGDIPQPYSVYAPYIGNDSPMQVDQKGLNDGSLCIQTFQDDYINTRQIYISFITNFHADVYVYRKYTDLYSLEGGAFETLKSNTMPPWLCGGDMSQGEDDTTSSVVMDTSRYDVCNANTDAGASYFFHSLSLPLSYIHIHLHTRTSHTHSQVLLRRWALKVTGLNLREIGLWVSLILLNQH